MQVSVESTGNLERRMTLRLPAERVDTQIGGRLREIARTAKIKGFRPGKVPAKVIEQRYGEQVRGVVLGKVDEPVSRRQRGHRAIVPGPGQARTSFWRARSVRGRGRR